MQFISFSSGSSGNCYLLKTEHNMLLLDAGLSPRKVKQYLSDYGLSLSDADLAEIEARLSYAISDEGK